MTIEIAVLLSALWLVVVVAAGGRGTVNFGGDLCVV